MCTGFINVKSGTAIYTGLPSSSNTLDNISLPVVHVLDMETYPLSVAQMTVFFHIRNMNNG